VTFNHGVEGSSPSALTIEIRYLDEFSRINRTACVCAVSANALPRRALALPIYTIALLLDFTGAMQGRLAAWIAGDNWPQ
jgi:hypothetical protein